MNVYHTRPSSFSMLATCFLATALLAGAGRAAELRLNVLFLAVDDLRPELNCYGKNHILSPDLDRLAAFYCDVLGFHVTNRGPVPDGEIAFLSQDPSAHHQIAMVGGAQVPDRAFVLVDHLAYEKRCFDQDGDGLYENFANTLISDAHHYSGGACTQASAYNYRAHLLAARLAGLIGKDPEPFRREAEKIRAAMNEVLWMPKEGWYAEYRDLLGLKRLHPSA